MRAIRKFEEFVKTNIIKKQSIDRSRAEFLIKEAENGYNNVLERIEKIKLNDDNANDYVKSCYDILMELTRARMLLEGYHASGFGAHEAEVAFMRRLGFKENEVQFADQMRFFRNGMLYYGTIIDETYAEKVIQFTQRIYPQLKVLVLATGSPMMKIQETITATLQKLSNHRFLSLVPRGNTAIEIAISSLPKNSALLIPEEGGWLSYKSTPKKFGLVVEEVKCNDSRINLQDLRQKFLSASNHYAALLYQNPGGYFAPQPMEDIYELCQKNSCLVIMDVSGAIGTELYNGNYADILVCSFGKWKLVDAGIGGFISAKEKRIWDKLEKNLLSFEDPIALATIQQKLEELPLRIQQLTELRMKVIEDLEKKKIEMVPGNDIGFVVVARYADEGEKNKITDYCRSNNLEYTECPRYIRLNKPAISIEVKRK